MEDIHAGDNRVEYVFESGSGFDSEDADEVFQTGVNITTDASGITLHREDDRENIGTTEFEGSFTVDFDGSECESVVCPSCNCVNTPPPTPLLYLFSEGPFPCVECGYPLL